MFCPQCGKEIPDNASFCGGCGKQMPTPSFNPAPTPAPKKNKLPLVVVGVVAVAVVAFILVRFVFAGAPTTAEGLADELASVTQTFFESDFSEEAAETYGYAMLDLMHDDIIDALLAESDYESEDDLVASLVDYVSFYFYIGSGITSDMMDYVDIEVSVYPSYQFDADNLEYLNEDLQELGIDLVVEDAVTLSMDIVCTFTQDYLTYSVGDIETYTSTNFAGEIDGRWYLFL